MLLPSSGSVSLILPGSFLSFSGPNSSLSEYFSENSWYVGSVLPSSFQLTCTRGTSVPVAFSNSNFLSVGVSHLPPGK